MHVIIVEINTELCPFSEVNVNGQHQHRKVSSLYLLI